MLDEADAARRRELQRRAFGTDDALTAAEEAELRDLEARRRASTPPPTQVPAQAQADAARTDASPAGSAGASTAPAESPDVTAAAAESPDAAITTARSSDTAIESSAAPAPSSSPRRRLRLTLAMLAAAVVGFAGGFLLPMRTTDSALAMNDEQRGQFTEIETSGEYDPGSVRFAGAKHGASAWSATRDDGALQCLVLRYGEKSSSDCYTLEQLESWGGGPSAQMQVSVDGELTYITAAVFASVSGEPATVIRSQTIEGSWRNRFTADELELAELLVDAGLDADQLQIVGYDDETPVWFTADGDVCLSVVDPATHDIARACDEVIRQQEPLVLRLPGVTYSLRWSAQRGPVLTVTKQSPPITCDVDSGYCASIDDTTGEIR